MVCGEMYIILLALMVPAASGLVDCRAACHSCRENKEVPAMVEVYCSMCEECKERRREKFAATSTTKHQDETIKFLADRVKYEEYPAPTTEQSLFGPTNDNIINKIRNEFATADRYPFGHFDEDHMEEPRRRRPAGRQGRGRHYVGDSSSGEEYSRLRPEDIPEGCPTPPICSDDEEPLREVLTVKPMTTTIATTTTTTTTRRPCPKIRPCKKKKKTTCPTMSCMPCMSCMPMCPCPMPTMCPGQACQPATAKTASIYVLPKDTGEYLTAAITPRTRPTTKSNDYIYMYVGVPKNVIKH